LVGSRSESAMSASPALLFFLSHDFAAADLVHDEVVDHYVRLDDSDILFSLKQWSRSEDRILRDLCGRFLERRLPRVTYLEEEPSDEVVQRIRRHVVELKGDEDTASYYFAIGSADHAAYDHEEDGIRIVDEDGTIRELAAVANASMV